MRVVPALLLSLTCLTAGAEEPSLPAPPLALPRLGVALDAGLPGGAGLAVQARALPWLRLGVGAMYSGVGYGAKGGLQLSPAWVVSPALELEGGWAPRADLSRLAGKGNVSKDLKPALAHASYWFGSALVGLDFGSPRGLSFMLHGGLSRLVVHTDRSATTSGSGAVSTVKIGKTTVTATLPCLKLGLQYWF